MNPIQRGLFASTAAIAAVGMMAPALAADKFVLGACIPIRRSSEVENWVGTNNVHPTFDAEGYIFNFQNHLYSRNLAEVVWDIIVVRPPKHGTIELSAEHPKAQFFTYTPESDYLGLDYLVMRARSGRIAVEIRYVLKVIGSGDSDIYCRRERWKISSTEVVPMASELLGDMVVSAAEVATQVKYLPGLDRQRKFS